ncbi:acyl-CoA dehydrogenase family protein [Acuticoccus sp. I52.16.1]|uniref:acyl-CoA dehydrogenase family protein n=1 Tax=Acuticoccus sp. I52.16.1 TaxID=2928472 RepID=UPI001FD5D1B7|nr:acyl-CoA dehydrogenase family protein [Acuticoccus sp. I52.16.1]UOM33025.1 acyl-CoA/acyl-ACP dehydrogenase [Acuticoccus sp. I52.16.1]
MSGAVSLAAGEDEGLLREAARSFLAATAPVARLRAMRDDGRTTDPQLWAEMVAMGWAGVLVPPDAGGADMGHRAAGILAEEMGRTLAVSPFLSTAVIAATALRAAGRSAALTAIAEGRTTYALALDEGRKFAPGATAMEAARAGNGYRLSGAKTFVAEGASATRLLVLARTAGAPGEAAGLTLFDIERDRAGITTRPGRPIDSGDRATIRFTGVEATGGDIVGTLDDGLAALEPALMAGQAALAAEMTGAAAATCDLTVMFMKERKQFDRLIGTFQALQFRVAHLWSEIEMTTSAIIHAGRVLDAGPADAGLAVSLAKARATATARLAVSESVQLHGGIGVTDALDLGFYMKRARVAAEWLGDYGYHAAAVARHRGLRGAVA